MSLTDLITYGAAVLYLFLAWSGRRQRPQSQADFRLPGPRQEQELSLEKLQAWRRSLGISGPAEKHTQRHAPAPVVQPAAKTGSVLRIQHPKAKVHRRTMPHNFRFQATLDKYRRATNIDTRDFSSRIEGRKAPTSHLVSAQLKDDAPADAYCLDKVEEKSLGWQTLQQVGYKKNLIIINELLGKPRAYLAPTRLPGHWWESQLR